MKSNHAEYLNHTSPTTQQSIAQAKNDAAKAQVEATIQQTQRDYSGVDFMGDDEEVSTNIPTLTQDSKLKTGETFNHQGYVYHVESQKTKDGKLVEVTAVDADTGLSHTINLQTNEVQKTPSQGENQTVTSTVGDQGEVSVPDGISGSDSQSGRDIREEAVLNLSDRVKDGDTIYQIRDPKSGIVEAKTVGVLASGKYVVNGQIYTKDQFDQVGYFQTEAEAKKSLKKVVAKFKLETNGLTPAEQSEIEAFKTYLITRPDKTTLPKLTVKREKGYQFNIYSETGIKVGYLPTTPQMEGLSNDQKIIINQIKDQLKDGQEVEFKYKIKSGTPYESNPKSLFERSDDIYSYNHEAVIFRQTKGANDLDRSISEVLGTLTQEDNAAILNNPNLTDSHVMKISDLDGRPRYIPVKPMEMDDSGYEEMSNILNSQSDPQAIVNELNTKFFIPANPLNGKRFHLQFKVFNGKVTLLLNENSKNSTLQRIFPINGIFNTKEGFLKSLKIESNKNAIPIKSISEVINYAAREIPPLSDRSFVLANLRANTTDRLFGGINIVPEGVVKKRSIISEENQISSQPIPVQPTVQPTSKKTLSKNIVEVEKPKSGIQLSPRTVSDIDMDGMLSVNRGEVRSKTDWSQVKSDLESILPTGFGLDRLAKIAEKNKLDGSTMGVFTRNVVYLADLTAQGTHYHEAFHAIFRKVFNQSEQQFYYRIAKTKIDTSVLAQERFLKENPHYEGRENVEGLMLEEYMSDLFQAYMNGKPTTILGKMFRFIKDLVNSLMKRGDELTSLFSRIDSGEFTFRSIKNPSAFGIDEVVYKRVPFAQVQESNELVRLLTIHYLENKTSYKEMENQLDKILLGLKNESSVDFDTLYEQEVSKIGDEDQALESLGQLWYTGVVEDGEDPNKAYRKVYAYEESTNVLKDQVKKNLKALDNAFVDKNDLTEDEVAVQTDEVTDRNWEQSPFEVNPTDDVSADVKVMINYTGYYLDGKLKPVDSSFVYNTLLLSLSGLETYDQMYNRLAKLAENNPQIAGIKRSLDNQVSVDPTFKTKFQQSFSLEKVEYTQIEYTENEGKPSTFKVFSANRKDTGDIQLNRWRNQYVKLSKSKVLEGLKEVVKSTRKLSEAIQFNKSYDKTDVGQYIKDLSNLGITLDQGFVEDVLDNLHPIYSWKEADLKRSFTTEMANILDIMTEGNPFGDHSIIIMEKDSPKVKEEKQKLIDATAITRLRRLGAEDAKYRTDILMTSFQNSENKTVYPFTAPSHLLTTGRKITEKDPSLLAKFQSAYYQLNPFIDQENRNANTLNKLKLSVFNGIRESKGEEGQTFKNIDSKSYHLSTFSLWQSGFLNPFQIEAKSISSLFQFPQLGRMVEDGKIAPWARTYLRNFYRQDQQLIQNSYWELTSLPDDQLIEGYHFIGYTNGKPNRNSYQEILDLIKEKKLTNNDLPRGFQVKQLPEMNTLFTHEAIVNGEVTDADIDIYYDNLFNQQLLPQLKSLLRDSDLDPNVAKERNLYYDPSKGGFKTVDDFLMEFLMEDFVYSNSYAQLHRGPEQYYKGGVDITKRAAGQSAAGRSLMDGVFHVALLTTQKVKKMVGGKEVTVDPTDAQGHMSGKRHLQVMEKLGRLTPQVRDQIERLIAGEEIEWMGDFTLIPWKNVFFNGEEYIKTSTLPLFKSLTSIRNEYFDPSKPLSVSNSQWIARPGMEYLHNLREEMDGEEYGVRVPTKPLIDEAYYDTAFKKNQKSKNFPTNGKWSSLKTIPLQNKDWRLQVENPSGKTKVTYGTQLLQLIDSEMSDDHMVEFQGQMVPLMTVRDQYQSLLSDIREDSMTKALDLMDKAIDGDNLFINRLTANLEASKSDNNTLEFFSQSEGKFKYSTDLPNLQTKFEEMFLSYFSKSVFNQKTSGLKLTLVSSFGVKNPQTGEDLKIHRLENGKIELAEIILSAEFLDDYDLTLEEFEALDQATKDEILTMVGYRIPTQSHHSMIPFKVVGFVPAYYGSIAIAPSEITYLSGADYDVDSLFVHRKEFRVKPDGSIELYHENKSAEALWEDYLAYNLQFNPDVKSRVKDLNMKNPYIGVQMAVKDILGMDKEKFMSNPKLTNAARYNKILDTQLSFLTNVQNAESLFTPASIDSLKDIARDIYEMTGEDENLTVPYQSYVSRYTAWINNSTGKSNVGNAASANKINAFLTKYGVELVEPVQFDGETFTGYADTIERDVSLKDGKVSGRITRRKGDSLSTLVSAMTDNAKERLAAKLNLTKNNLSVFSNMISLGMGLNRTMLMAKQPVMVEITKQFTSKSAIIASPGSSYGLVEKYLLRLDDLLGKNNQVVTPITSEGMVDHINDNLILDSKGVPYKSIKGGESANGHLAPEDISKFQWARTILLQYQQLSAITDDFSRVGKILSLDKEVGIEFTKMDDTFTAHQTVTGEKTTLKVAAALFRDKNIQMNLENLWKVKSKAEAYFLSRTPRFQKEFNRLVDLGVKNQSITKLRKDYVTYLGLRRIEADLKPLDKSLSSLISLIHSGEDNITSQFDKTLSKFPELKENKFVGQLQKETPRENGNHYYRLSYNTRMKNDPLFTEELQNGYKALQSHYSPEVRKFATTLFNYLTIKDSLNQRNESFIKLINPTAFQAISLRLKGGFLQNGNKVVGTKDLYSIPLDPVGQTTHQEEFKKMFKSLYKETPVQSYRRFVQLFFSQKANREGVEQFGNKKVQGHFKQKTHEGKIYREYDFSKSTQEDLAKMGIPSKDGKVFFPLIFRQYTSANPEYNAQAYNTIWIRQVEKVEGNQAYYTKLEENKNRYLSPYTMEYDQVIEESKKTPVRSEGEPDPDFVGDDEITPDIQLPTEPKFEGNIVDQPKKSGIVLDPSNVISRVEDGKGTDFSQRESNEVAARNLISTLDKLSKRFGIPYILDENLTTLGRFVDGKVYINPTLAKSDTPFHEFAHPFIHVIKKENPILYRNLVKQILAEGKILRDVQRTYPDLSPSDQIEEAIVTAIGQSSVQPKGLMEAIRQFFKRLVGYFKGLDIVVPSNLNPNTTLRELGVIVSGDSHIDLTSTGLQSWDQRVLLQPIPQSPLGKVIDDIKILLERQIGMYKKRVNTDSQKKYLAKLESLSKSLTDDIQGVSDFVTQASTTIHNLRVRMDGLSTQKSNSEQIRELVQIAELSQSFNLLDDIKTALRGELGDQFRSSPFVQTLKEAISEREDLLTDYMEKGIPLLANYLYDQYDDSLNSTLTGDNEKFQLTKEKLISQLKENPKDISTIAKLLFPAINTDDAVLSLFAKGLKRQLDDANQLDIEVEQRLVSAKLAYQEESGVNKDKIKDFNAPFIVEADFKLNKSEKVKRLKLIDINDPTYKTLSPAAKDYHTALKDVLMASQQNIPESSKLGLWLPGIRKSPNELLLEGKAQEAAKEKLKDLTTFQVDDSDYGLQTLSGDQAKFIPIYYTSRLEVEETSNDLLQSIMRYSQSTNKYRAYNEVSGEVNLAMDLLAARDTLEVNSKGDNKSDSLAKKLKIDRFLKKPGTSNTFERFKSFVDMVYYGESEDKITVNVAGREWSANKVFGSLASATSIISLSGNLLQAINNVTVGNYMTILESVGGRYFNKKDLAKAAKEYWFNVPQMVADIQHKGYKSKVGQLMDMYDAIQGQFRDEYGKDVSGSVARKLMSTSTLFFFQKTGEHQIQVTNALAFLQGQKVMLDGKTIPLYEAYELDSKGKLKLKDGVEWTNDQRRGLMNKIHKVNKESNGVYNKFDSLQIQKSAWGKMALIFRKFIVPTIRKRYDGLRVDYEENALAEGYYRTMFRFLSDYKNFKSNVIDNWSSLQPFERENIRKTILELGTMVLLFVAMLGLTDDDDEEKEGRSYLSALTLYEAKRLQSDLMFYTPGFGLKDQWRVLKSPTALYGTVEKTASVLGQALYYNYKEGEFGFTEEYKRDSGLNQKGDSKLWAKMKKVIPVVSKFELSTNPEEAYKSFLKANQ